MKEDIGNQKGLLSGVILAGGTNSRFNGITKANLFVGGKSIISRMFEIITEIFTEIIIVTNTPEEFKEYSNYKIVSDHFLKVGPLGGIHAALKASSNCGVFVFAGDMPLLNKGLIINQINYYSGSDCDILIPQTVRNIEPLHAIYNISILEKLEEYLAGGNDYAVREFFKKVNTCYMQIQGNDGANNSFTNINSPSDIKDVEKNLRYDS